MLARWARVAPACMARPSPAPYLTPRRFSSCTMLMPLASGRVSDPLAPLMVTACGVTVALTPCGRSTGALATLDMVGFPSGHDAQYCAALADRAGLAVGHDALRRGDDHGPHPAQDLRQLVLASIDAQAGATHPLQAVDDGTALVI